jgi:hypothetical protein
VPVEVPVVIAPEVRTVTAAPIVVTTPTFTG